MNLRSEEISDSRVHRLVRLFETLEKSLEYPQCEGLSDRRRYIDKFEKDVLSFLER